MRRTPPGRPESRYRARCVVGLYNRKRRHSALGYSAPTTSSAPRRRSPRDPGGTVIATTEPTSRLSGSASRRSRTILRGYRFPRSWRILYLHRLPPTSVLVAKALNRPPDWGSSNPKVPGPVGRGLRDRHVLRLCIAEALDLVALDAARLHPSDSLVVVRGARLARVNQQLRDCVDGDADRPAHRAHGPPLDRKAEDHRALLGVQPVHTASMDGQLQQVDKITTHRAFRSRADRDLRRALQVLYVGNFVVELAPERWLAPGPEARRRTLRHTNRQGRKERMVMIPTTQPLLR